MAMAGATFISVVWTARMRSIATLGHWQFQDITETAGVACSELDATGAVLVDIEGDGDLDLIVNSIGGGTHVFLNDGRGISRKSAVLNVKRGGASLGDMMATAIWTFTLPTTGRRRFESQLTVRYWCGWRKTSPWLWRWMAGLCRARKMSAGTFWKLMAG